jgi:spermidine synthase
MKPWTIVERARTPGGRELTLSHHDGDYTISVEGQTLMSSRAHGSEEALAVLGCRRARKLPAPGVLIGGLGMGFTLRAALDVLPPTATVIVSEIVPAIVRWNQGVLGPLTRHAVVDPRVRLDERGVAAVMQSNQGRFHAVLLDVDNGPAALTQSSNAGLYDDRGVAIARASLTWGGVLAVWSAGTDPRFVRRLYTGGFTVQRERAWSGQKKGSRHTILLAFNGPEPVTP